MSFLKKLGQIIATGLKVVNNVSGFIPYIPGLPAQVGSIVTEVKSDLGAMASAIVGAEVIGNALALPGTDKLRAAVPGVEQVILASEVMRHRKIKDEAKFKAAVAGLASNMADLLNSLEDNIDTTDKS